MLDIELRHDAGLRLLVGRLTDRSAHLIFDVLFVAYALRLTLWAAAIGQVLGYPGPWLLGMHGSDLRRLRSHRSKESMLTSAIHAYDTDDYREITTATHIELLEHPGQVAERLAGRLVRALGTEAWYASDFGARA